jgi:hypothetical protein
MGRIINETAKGGLGGGLKLTAMLGGILFIGNVLTKAMKPIFKMMDILSTILGAALMPIAMIFFNLLRPLLYILLPLVRFMWNIWRPIQRQMAENLKARLKPGMSSGEKAGIMSEEALKAGGAFFLQAITDSLAGIGSTVTGGAMGENKLGNAIAGLFTVLAGKVVLDSLLAAAGSSIAAISARLGMAIYTNLMLIAYAMDLDILLGKAGSSLSALGTRIGANIGILMGAVAGFFIAQALLDKIGVNDIAKNIAALMTAAAFALAATNPALALALGLGALVVTAISLLFQRIAADIDAMNAREKTPEFQAAAAEQKRLLNQQGLGIGTSTAGLLGGGNIAGYGLNGNLSNLRIADSNPLNIGNQTNSIVINVPNAKSSAKDIAEAVNSSIANLTRTDLSRRSIGG